MAAWLAEKSAGTEGTSGPVTFGDFCDRHCDEELLAFAIGEHAPADQSRGPTVSGEAGVVVRVPGPLQRFVDGADELIVAGATVGDVLAELAHRYPEFGDTVTPDGAVAGAFLITHGDDDIRNLEGLNTPVAPGDTITVVMAMAGG